MNPQIAFPPVQQATPEGLLAIGGDLSRARLLAAYQNGIFPWYNAGQPILWWSPNPRCVLFPTRFRPQRRVQRIIRKGEFAFTLDADFARVIDECAAPRHGQNGTWITPEMRDAYLDLHRAGYAHSAEVWRDGRLLGGLYGVALGAAFFGESMFSRAANASKVALAMLMRRLAEWEFSVFDCQVVSAHLLRLGAEEIPREEFVSCLREAVRRPGWAGG